MIMFRALRYWVAAATLIFLIGIPDAARAQGRLTAPPPVVHGIVEDCVCTVQMNRVPVAQLDNIQGTVRIAAGDGFTPVTSGLALVVGDRVVFQDGMALLSAGPECQTPVGPNMILNVRQVDRVVCVSSDPLALLEENVVDDTKWQYLAIGGGALLIGGAGVAAWLLLDDDDPTSP